MSRKCKVCRATFEPRMLKLASPQSVTSAMQALSTTNFLRVHHA